MITNGTGKQVWTLVLSLGGTRPRLGGHWPVETIRGARDVYSGTPGIHRGVLM